MPCLQWFKQKQGAKSVTLVLIGLDNAGKTTLLNTVRGELDKDVAPTVGFNQTSLPTKFSKYKVEVFDLGGGSRIRGIWKRYFSEVHGVIFVLDSADKGRFEEARRVLEQAVEQAYMTDKPLLVFANKQDLPTAIQPSDIEQALGLSKLCATAFNMVPCVAKCSAGQQPDSRLRDGVSWLMSAIDNRYGALSTRVRHDMEQVKQEEVKYKAERDKRVALIKEERVRKEQLQEAEEAAAAASQANALAALPNQIMSPGKVPEAAGVVGEGSSSKPFSDMLTNTPEQRSGRPASSSGAPLPSINGIGRSASGLRMAGADLAPFSGRPSSGHRGMGAVGSGMLPRPPPLVLQDDCRKRLPAALPTELPPSDKPLHHLADAIHHGSVVESKLSGLFQAAASHSSFQAAMFSNKVTPVEGA